MVDDILNDTSEQRDYLSYLLRLWRVGGDGGMHREEEAIWRASLESPLTGQRIGFASLDALIDFLREQTDDEASYDDPPLKSAMR